MRPTLLRLGGVGCDLKFSNITNALAGCLEEHTIKVML